MGDQLGSPNAVYSFLLFFALFCTFFWLFCSFAILSFFWRTSMRGVPSWPQALNQRTKYQGGGGTKHPAPPWPMPALYTHPPPHSPMSRMRGTSRPSVFWEAPRVLIHATARPSTPKHPTTHPTWADHRTVRLQAPQVGLGGVCTCQATFEIPEPDHEVGPAVGLSPRFRRASSPPGVPRGLCSSLWSLWARHNDLQWAEGRLKS